MLGQVNETQYDFRFSLFGIPVRVHPTFWLAAVIMGGNLFRASNGVTLVGIWMVVMFVSILIHELGHALAAKYYGWPPNIVLYHFGGYAAYHPSWGNSSQRTIIVLIAGPGAGFILYGLLCGFEHLWVDELNHRLAPLVRFTLKQLKHVNLWWGVINLLPVLPLDGGQICQEVLKILRYRSWLEITLKISMVVAVAAALVFLRIERQFAGLLFLFLGISNYQTFQTLRGRGGGGGYW